ncbi:MAG: polyhydroxyalkanoate synthesis repressor PhaR, partial [Pseudomonadota bacterium]
IVIKKYANRRLYNTRTSAYVTLDDLAAMVRDGKEFIVQDAKTSEDITRGVLGQIIFDAESRGTGLLPIAFLRQLITFYDGQMQSVVPAYLEHSLASFAREQEKLGRHLNQAIGAQAINAVEEQVRANMDMFQRSMRMFMPFTNAPPSTAAEAAPEPARPNGESKLANDVETLKAELANMQARVAALSTPQPVPSRDEHSAHPLAGDEDEDDGFVVDAKQRHSHSS